MKYLSNLNFFKVPISLFFHGSRVLIYWHYHFHYFVKIDTELMYYIIISIFLKSSGGFSWKSFRGRNA